jgi:hypothetical protein
MLINISIHADNPADYRDALKALNEGAGLAELDLGEILPEVKVTPVVTKAAPTKQAAPVQAPVPSTEELPIPAPKTPNAPQQAAVPAQDRAPGGSTQEETAPKPVTLNELQALGRKVALAGHQDALAKVLAKYGASNLSSVPEESRAAALADLEAAND